MKSLETVEREFRQVDLEKRWKGQQVPLRFISGTPLTGTVKVVRAQEQDAIVQSEHGITWHLRISDLERLEALGQQEPRLPLGQRLTRYARRWWRAPARDGGE